MIWYVPLEPLEERYTAQMFHWCIEGFNRKGVEFRTIEGETLTKHIQSGEVLDAEGTNFYKASQLKTICQLFKWGDIKNGDWFFIADLWFPGIEIIRYIEAQKQMSVNLAGVHYAGVFDQHDFVHKMRNWAKWNETGWLTLANVVFVGSEFHRNLILDGLGGMDRDLALPFYRELANIKATGLVWDADSITSNVTQRERTVIFPHRIDTEKNPEAFFRLATRIKAIDPTVKFLITSSRKEIASNIKGLKIPSNIVVKDGLTKQQYYDELARSKVLFSSAFQETFGYALNEGLALGCVPICPNRLSYPEVLEGNPNLLYNSEEDAVQKVLNALDTDESFRGYTLKYSKNMDKMIEEMK